MKSISKNILIVSFLGFIYPFGGLIYSIKSYRQPGAKLLFYIFCLFVGYTFIYQQEGTSLGEGIDGSRYAYFFIKAHNLQLSWSAIFNLIPNSVDFYNVTVTYILSRFTGNPHLLFLVYAGIMGYFLTQNLWIIFEHLTGKINPSTIILILLLALVCPIWLINGVRMWTALHVFVYGVLRYVFNAKNKSLGWCIISILIHFSFIFPLSILVVYFLIPGKNIRFFFIFFIITFFIQEINFEFLRQFLTKIFPDNIQDRIGYIDEEYMVNTLTRLQEQSFHLIYKREAYKYLVLIMAIRTFFLIEKKKVIIPDVLMKLFCLSLFFYGVSIIISIAPTGQRFLSVANTFILSFFVLFSNYQILGNLPFRKTIIWLSPFIIFLNIIEVRMGLGFLGPSTFIGNFIVAPILEINIPLIIFIKELFI